MHSLLLPQHCTLPRRAVLQRVAAALCCAAWQPGVQAQPAPVVTSSVINRAARFRALSQRIAKAYCQIFLGVQPKEAAAVLAASRALLHVGFEELLKEQWPAVIGQSLAQVRSIYTALDAQLVMPPTRDTVIAVAAQADNLLAATEVLTAAFEKVANRSANKVLTMAGRQRILSQRLAKNYFLLTADLAGNEVKTQRVADAAEFKRALGELAQMPVTNAGIRGEIESGEMQWVFFEAALARQPDERGQLAVATTSERLLEVMEKLTVQYEVALKDER